VNKLMCCCGGVATAANSTEQEANNHRIRRFAKLYTLLKMFALVFVSVLSIGEQCVEIYFVLKSRFHYTSDIVIALVLTFLFYTNSAIAVFSKQWELRGIYLLWGGSPERILKDGKDPDATAASDVEKWHQKDMWVSKGDVFVPWCCFPFCCMSGRNHVYSDDGILEIYDSVMGGAAHSHLTDAQIEHHIQEFVQEMNLLEGIPQAEVLALLGLNPEMHSNHAKVQKLKVSVMNDSFSTEEHLSKKEKYVLSPQNRLEGLTKHRQIIQDKMDELRKEHPELPAEGWLSALSGGIV